MLGDKAPSDEGRIVLFKQVMSALTPLSLFVGHGFGIGIAEKPVHMEISYLEILHKQGLLGLLFWFMLFVLTVRMYFRACRNGYRRTALPFMLSSLLIFILTATNNYMNNPLGMSMLLVSFGVLNVLSKNNCFIITKQNKGYERMSSLQIPD